MTTEKFIKLETEELRQKQFDDSLSNVKDAEDYDKENLDTLINCYIDIANADDFIHENEVTLIQHAIKIWGLDIVVNKPKSGERLQIEEV